MRVALAVVTLLAACASAPSPAEVSRHNTSAIDAAIARAQARFGGAPFQPAQVSVRVPGEGYPGYEPAPDPSAPPPPAPERLTARVRGQGADDALYRLPSGALAFAGPTCLMGDSCGCEVGIDYRYLQRDDGQIAVVRLTPEVKTYTLELDTCGYGCGQPPPPAWPTAADLGVTAADAIEVIEAPYRFERVVTTCANPIPAP